MGIVALCVRRPVLTTVAVGFFLVMGALGYRDLPLDLVPRIDVPVVTVVTVYPGAAPGEVEALVSRVIEDAVSSVNGIDYMKSESLDSVSQVLIFFRDGIDVDGAANDVREQISAAMRDLPAEVEAPKILKLDINATPVLTVALVSERLSPGELTEFFDRTLKDRFANVDGVAQVDLIGGRRREIHLVARADRLARYGISLGWLAGALQAASVDIPGGRITGARQEFAVTFSGEAKTVEELRALRVTLPTGASMRLDELAEVRDTYADERERSRFDGKPAVFLVIKKRSDANAVATVESVRAAMALMERELPAGTAFREARETASYVRNSLDDLYLNMAIGIALTAAVLYLFLGNWQGTVIAALAIPFSIIASFWFIGMLGFTLNMMSLMALAISVGILVNNAIIVLENIIARLERGEPVEAAAVNGTNEIMVAVTGATLTNVVVFVPIAFMSGIIGKFFKEFGLTATVATLASLALSFTLTPMMAAWLIRRTGGLSRAIPFQSGVDPCTGMLARFARLQSRARDGYLRLLGRLVGRPGALVAVSFALLAASFALAPFVGFEFMTEGDQAVFNIAVRMPPGSTLAATDRAVREIERIAGRIPERLLHYAKTGKTENIIGGASESIEIGEVTVKLRKRTERRRSDRRIAESLVSELAAIPGATVSLVFYGVVGAEEAPIQIEAIGPDLARLEELSAGILARVRDVPGTADLDTTYLKGKPEIRVVPDRLKAREAGIPERMMGLELRGRYEGLVPLKLREGSREYDVRLRGAAEERADDSGVALASLVTPAGVTRPLADLAKLRETVLPAKISRKDRQRMIAVTGRAVGRSYGEVMRDIKAALAGLDLPPGYRIRYAGMEDRMKDMVHLVEAFGIATLLTFMLLAALLESWTLAATILMTLPLSLIGVMLGLFLTDSTLSIFSLMAVVMLVGLVVNNGILIVEAARDAAGRGLPPREAVLDACRDRFRPIAMTSLATALAMVPLALGLGEGAEMRASMAIVSIGGLAVSTVLSLFVVPALCLRLGVAAASPAPVYNGRAADAQTDSSRGKEGTGRKPRPAREA